MRTLNNTKPTKTSSNYTKLTINSSSTHYNCSPAQRMNLNLIYPYNASNRVNHSFINRGSDHVHKDHTPNDPTCTEPPNSHMPGAQAWRSVKRRHAKAASRWLGGSMMAHERRTTLINQPREPRTDVETHHVAAVGAFCWLSVHCILSERASSTIYRLPVARRLRRP